MSFENLWENLLANLAILGVLVLAWAHFQHLIARWPRLARNVGFGFLMGIGAALVMEATVELYPGLYFDLRSVAIALAGVFAGPVGALIAVAVGSVQRLLMGGDGAVAGIVTMIIAAVMSVAGYYARRGRTPTLRYVVVFGLIISAAITGAVIYAALRFAPDQVVRIGTVLSIVSFVSFVFGGAIMVQEMRQRRLRDALAENQALLGHALAEMSDGIAMFDADRRLVFSNEQYRTYFPLTRDLRVPGADYRDILRGVVERREQIGASETDGDAWVEETVALLNNASEEEVQLFDGRWLGLRTRPAADGSCMVVVSDLTRHKKDQRALREMTERLQLLAATDGLTGIGNRRAFDAALARETDIAARTSRPLSVLLVDIDWFKSFNDEYGHVVGDRCLRAIAHGLRAVVHNPADLVARYGGEEFVALLPGFDVGQALALAEEFSRTIHARGIEHVGSPKGIVTASVGVASWAPEQGPAALSDLVRDADIALYRAKQSGRDLVCTKDRQRVDVAGAA